MDFGHLLQRQWIIKPRVGFDGLQRYQLPVSVVRQLESRDVVAAFVHHGCVLLACYRGRWKDAVRPKEIKDWFCSHVMAYCLVYWMSVHGRIWQRNDNPYHLYFQFNSSTKTKAVDDFAFDRKATRLEDLSTLLRTAHERPLTDFVLMVSFVILSRVGEILTRRRTGDVNAFGEQLVICFTYSNRPPVCELQKVLLDLWTSPRAWGQPLAGFSHHQFVQAGQWESKERKDTITLLTHYCGFGLLRFWGLPHYNTLVRISSRFAAASRYFSHATAPVECYIRGCFDGRVHVADSARVVMHLLMVSTGSVPHALEQLMLKDEKVQHGRVRSSGPSTVSDSRRLLLLGLFEKLNAAEVLNSPYIRYGMYAYARDAFENQVNVVNNTRWRSSAVSADWWIRYDELIEMHHALDLPSSSLDDVCIQLLQE